MNKNKGKEKKSKLNRFQLYFLYFLLFSFLGWAMETIFALFNLGYFVKRGFLFGPICPIYGYGALMLIIFFNKYKKNNLKLFTYSAIIFSTFEYIVSYCLSALFQMNWWDYTNEFMNLNGRISIFYSFAWGIIAILFINYIYPFFKTKINVLLSKIPYIVQSIIINTLLITFIVDTIFSCVRYLAV